MNPIRLPKLVLIGGLTTLTLIAAACGSDPEAAPSPTPTQVATATPEPTPSPTPPPAPAPDPTVAPSISENMEFTETQVIAGRGISIDYPSGWTAGTRDDITAIHELQEDHERFLSAGDGPPPAGPPPPPGPAGPGHYAIEVEHVSVSFLRSAGLPDSPSLEDLLAFNNGTFRWRVIEKVETSVFGRPAVRLLLGSPDPDRIAVIGFSGDRAFMLTLRASSEDAGREFVPVLEKMLASAKAGEEPPLTPEQQYYAEVQEARALTEARMRAFGAMFSQVYQTRALLMGALLRAGVGTAFIDSVEALEKIDPPDRFVPEHRVVLDGYRELARLDDEARQAVEAVDMAGFVLTNGRLEEVGAGIPLWLSAEFCHEVLRDSPLCSPLQSPPGGAYGGQLFESLRLLEANLAGPNGAMVFPLSLNPEENLAVFNEVVPSAAKAVRDAKARLAALSAPSELSSDHDQLLELLDRLTEVYDSVATAAGAGHADGARTELSHIVNLECEAVEAF